MTDDDRTDGLSSPSDLSGSVVLSADELLDMAEEHLLHDREQEVADVEEAFDAAYAGAELTSLQRARRADIRGLRAAADGDAGVAEIAWTSALELFREAGDEVRRQTTLARYGMLLCRMDRTEVGLPMTIDATEWLVAHAGADRHCSALRRAAFAYAAAGRFDDALDALDRAAALASLDRDPFAACKLLVERTGLLAQADRIAEAESAAGTGLQRCREAGYRSGEATLHWILGRLAQEGGDRAAARAAYDEALAVTDHPAFRREIRRTRATMLASTGDAAEAIDDLSAELADALDEGDSDAILLARYHLATANLNASRPLRATDLLEEILAGLEAGSPAAVPVRHMLAFTYQLLDQPDVAIGHFAAVADAARTRQNTALVAEMQERIGEVLDRQDRDALAARRFTDAALAYRQSDLPTAAVRASRRAAVSHMWARAIGEAIEALGRADELAAQLPRSDAEAQWERAMLAVDGARVLARAGERGAAIIRCAPAITLFEAVGDRSAAAFARGIHGELLVSAGRLSEAEAVLAVAAEEGDDNVRTRAEQVLHRVREIIGRDG